MAAARASCCLLELEVAPGRMRRMKASHLGIVFSVGLALLGCGSGPSGGSGGAGGAGASGGSGGAGASGGAGGAGGGMGGAGGSGGMGGSGGGAMAIASQGTVTDTCGPADGPALSFLVGTPAGSSCAAPAGNEPHALFYAYPAPGGTSGLMAGQTWSSNPAPGGKMVSVQWFPNGASGADTLAQSGSIEITAVQAGKVRVKYTFVTAAGETRTGEADLAVCPSTPMCG
jgi:hypothetical protein